MSISASTVADFDGPRTLATTDIPADDFGVFATITVDDDSEVWNATGSGSPTIVCGPTDLGFDFSIDELSPPVPAQSSSPPAGASSAVFPSSPVSVTASSPPGPVGPV